MQHPPCRYGGAGADDVSDPLAAGGRALPLQMILSELLGSLFIHPARLQWEGLLGQGGFATVHRAR